MRDIGLDEADDDALIALALREGRFIITHDKDFGNILTYPQRRHGGVILIRLRLPTPKNACAAIRNLLAAVPESKLYGNVAVLEEGRIRISRGR